MYRPGNKPAGPDYRFVRNYWFVITKLDFSAFRSPNLFASNYKEFTTYNPKDDSMNANKLKYLIAVSVSLLNGSLAFGQSPTSFTYQGRLTDSGSPANGSYDLEFFLLDATLNPLNLTRVDPVPVSNGLFTVLLDFGSAFDGTQRSLRIGVRTHGDTNFYTFVSPPQIITSAPYAIHAVDSTVPSGSIMPYMGTNAPAGWLLCDGAAVSRTQYATLFGVIGVSNGSGDGMSTFNLPDLRGMFLRGLDGVAGIDPDKATRTAAKPGGNTGNALGSLQQDQFKSHNHVNGSFVRLVQQSNGTSTTTTATDVTPSEPDIVNTALMLAAGGNESRPKNVYVNYIIKL